MRKNTDLLLKDILLKTFFDLTMFEIIPVITPPKQEPKTLAVYSITTHSPEKFRLNFFLPDEIQKIIVENIFEKSIEELSKEQVNDCILEIVNIVAGNFFTAYFKDETIFEMGLPHIYHDLKTDKENKCPLYFMIDNAIFKVELS